MKSNRTNWDNMLSNAKVLDAYSRFATGKSTRTDLEREFKNTEYAGSFRTLVRNGGAVRAKNATRKALQRRRLLS